MPKQLSILWAAKSTFMNGTFFTAPRLFYQLFTIFVTIQGHVFPVWSMFLTVENKIAIYLYLSMFCTDDHENKSSV